MTGNNFAFANKRNTWREREGVIQKEEGQSEEGGFLREVSEQEGFGDQRS